MLNKMTCVVVLAAGASLLAGAAPGKETLAKIDAYTLLIELQEMVKEVPETKEGCQAALEKIRAWQETRLKELQDQRIRPKYGFECQWVPQDYEDSRACTQVLLSKERAVQGRYSLKMMMDLVAGDKERDKGEAWINMLENPPHGEHIPVNLRGRTVTASVYAPRGARGERSRPNGFQVFVKDKKWKSQYGPWHNVREEDWMDISLKVSRFNPPGGHTDPGFDPTQIIAVGVKMGAGGGSKAKYKDPVFIDAVDW